MKVLLFGEFSGVHKNLKDGLLELGCNAVVASTGDAFKKFEKDISLSLSGNPVVRVLSKYTLPLMRLKALTNYDVVQFINPFQYPPPLATNIFANRFLINNYNARLIRHILRNNGKTFLVGAGCDAFTYKAFNSELEYGPCKDCQEIDLKGTCIFASEDAMTWNAEMADLVDGIIPILYDYVIAYKGRPNLRKYIPLPMNLSKIKYVEKTAKGKLVIYHPVLREGFKGTPFIKEALNRVEEKYPDDVEVIMSGGMSLNDYLNVLERADVVIDQCHTHSYGMSTLYSMAMGKVVLSGWEESCSKEIGMDDCPVINIKPSVEDIENKIISLIEKRSDIQEMGLKSREFVEKHHDYIKVAQRYIDTWKD